MIIDKEQLISLLIEKTDLDREEVDGQLSILIDRIKQAADEGKVLEVEGFGTFAMKDDNLEFTPTDVLETEINNKYAGMKPIELIGAFKEPEGDEIPDIDKEAKQLNEETWSFDKESLEGSPVSASSRDSETEETRAEADEEVEAFEEEAEAAADTEGESDEDEGSPESDVSETKAEDDDKKRLEFGEVGTQEEVEKIFAINKEPEASEEDGTEEAESEEQPLSTNLGEKKEDDPIGKFLVAAIVVLAVGIGGWFVYDFGLIGGGKNTSFASSSASEPVENVTVKQSDSQQEEVQESSKTTKNDKTSEPEQTLQVVKPEDDQNKSQDQQKIYGLHGELSNVSGGYTIVVHSLRTMQKAENKCRQLEEQGFRTLINKAEVNGTTYYRVGIGQFKTVGDAQDSIKVLQEPLRSNNFIKRIR